MAELAEGEEVEVPGSGSARYTLRHTTGVYSCSCPAWRNQNVPIERRTCKHLRRYLGDAVETARVGTAGKPARPARAKGATGADAAAGAGADAGAEPPLLLAQRWESDVELTGWWMSEKLDGIRAFWDGTRFLSRLGNPFFPPGWFVAKLPRTPLDGELWGGRKKFQRTSGIVRQREADQRWQEISYLVFDAPMQRGPFEERLEQCRRIVAKLGLDHVRVLEHERCRGADHLRKELARVEALGGEGLMLRQPGSAYEAGRSSTLLKVKSFQDAEARVVGHIAGAGRHKGRLGALQAELPDGTRFSVGTGLSDREREAPPAVGSIITFRFQELSDRGVPRFPSFVGVRDDVRLEAPATAQPKSQPKPKPQPQPQPQPKPKPKPMRAR